MMVAQFVDVIDWAELGLWFQLGTGGRLIEGGGEVMVMLLYYGVIVCGSGRG